MTIPANATSIGRMAMLSMVATRLFQYLDADSTSDVASSRIRHITPITLTSATPTEANVVTTDVVLSVEVVLRVLNIDDSIDLIPPYVTSVSILHMI